MPGVTIQTVIKLVIASLVVGAILAYFELSPQELMRGLFGNVQEILDWAMESFGSALSYVLLGAVIVVPLWLISYVLRWVGSKGK
jgi:flagellar biosynthesis protein FlhB